MEIWRRVRTSTPAGLLVVLPVLLVFLYGLAMDLMQGLRSSYDERLFLSVADYILRTGRPISDVPPPAHSFFDHTPLYPYLLAVPAWIGGLLGGFELILGRAMSVAFGLGTVGLVFVTGRTARGPVAGLAAAALVAVNPFFVHASLLIHMEVPMAFFLVLGLYFLVREQVGRAGLAVAIAVLLKEFAFAFWLVASGYVLIRKGPGDAARFAAPAIAGFVGWLAIAYAIDPDKLVEVLGRWTNSLVGADAGDTRFRVGLRDWIHTIGANVIGLTLGSALLVAIGFVALRRPRVPPIAWIPIIYIVVMVGATFVIQLKEPRWLIAVVPMGALAVALLIDEARVPGWIHGLHGPRGPSASGEIMP